ncbi:MAG: putative phosphatase [Deltaproteobacteria bacterium]|nr:putative phosphatase [Deltaproteobacteria bacterium]
MHAIRTVIFDFDGTLTPLTLDFSLLRARVEDIAREYVGQHVIDVQKDQYIIEMIHAIDDEIDQSTTAFRDRAFRELDRLEIEACRNKELYPYTRDVLAYLKKHDIFVGIITRSSAKVIQTIFPDFATYIDVIVTREDTRYVKPDPHQLRMALETLSVRPEDAIIIGDHPTDIAAGKALGALSAGVLTGRCTADQFRDAGADYIFDDIRSILDILQHDVLHHRIETEDQ